MRTVVGPTLAEASPDAAPEGVDSTGASSPPSERDVERYLAVIDAAFTMGFPNLEAETRAFFEKLVEAGRGPAR